MSKENNTTELAQHIKTARDALDAALRILNVASEPAKKAKAAKGTPTNTGPLDFTMSLRAFVKKHSARLNGAKKFTLLLAYLSKGDTSKTVELADIESQWNKMTSKSLLGMKFNRLYTSESRENDWSSTEKAGLYRLRPSWKAIFNG